MTAEPERGPRLPRVIDRYLLLILTMVALASFAPVRGEAAETLGWITKAAIALVFFLHGARLSHETVASALGHWRLHLLVLGTSFALFPLLCFGAAHLPAWIAPPALTTGIIFLGCLPSTVQSSIGFTAIARGNVAAAVAAASASNLLGVFVTPLLTGLLLHAQGTISTGQIAAVALQLLAPFIAGQVARRWIGDWVKARAKLLTLVDRGSILLVVYSAFSGAVVEGIWSRLGVFDLVRMLVICAVLLAIVLAATRWAARAMGFSREDEIAIVFCGSKKSLASGVPMAGLLFPAATAGVVLLPLMLYHQIQLMACAVIAQAYARRAPD